MRLALVSSRERALCGFIPYPENLPRFISSAFLSGARPSSPTSIDPDQVLKEVIFNNSRVPVSLLNPEGKILIFYGSFGVTANFAMVPKFEECAKKSTRELVK